MGFITDTGSLAAEGSPWLFEACSLLDGMRRDEKLAVLVLLLF